MITRPQKQNLLKSIQGAQATAFQRHVWATLLLIPRGEVRTYEWVAKKIGSPKAARAVGSAVAKNPFAPQVPCHRVVRKDGKLGKYSGPGGARKKQELLRQEGVRNLFTRSTT